MDSFFQQIFIRAAGCQALFYTAGIWMGPRDRKIWNTLKFWWRRGREGWREMMMNNRNNELVQYKVTFLCLQKKKKRWFSVKGMQMGVRVDGARDGKNPREREWWPTGRAGEVWEGLQGTVVNSWATPLRERANSLQPEWELRTKTHGFRVLQAGPRGSVSFVFLEEAEPRELRDRRFWGFLTLPQSQPCWPCSKWGWVGF